MANLVHPDVPDASLTQNTVIYLGVCGPGVAALLVARAVLRVRRVHSTALRCSELGNISAPASEMAARWRQVTR